MKRSEKAKAGPKFRVGEWILVRAVVGVSGEADGGLFVRLNPDDPEVWVHLSDVRPLTARESGQRQRKGRG
jgi:hypothetical protein